MTTDGWLIADTDPGALQPALVGSKGSNLARLAAAGVPCPPWAAVSTEAMRAVWRHHGLDESVRASLDGLHPGASPDEIERRLEPLRGLILTAAIDPALTAAVGAAVARLDPSGVGIAVRSSAVDEDTGHSSMAGLHDSFLFVRGEAAAIAAVRGVWASAFNIRAVLYRLERGIPLEGISIAALLQRMAEPRASGVMFTVNPTSGNVLEMVINSLWGVGEGLVSEGLDADSFVWRKQRGVSRRSIATKTEMIVADAAGGTARRPVPDALCGQPSLEEAQVALLAALGEKLERHFRAPQDIEFVRDNADHLWIVQARPVTTAAEDGPAAGNHTVWDNSNIIESYSGPTSPMTFSFIRHAYAIVYHCFSEVMGINAATVRAHRHVFTNMLGLFHGQVYYNLRNWYRLVRLFPGFSYNKAFMESMMGVRDRFDLDEAPVAPTGPLRRYTVELPRLVRLVLRSVGNFRRIDRLVSEFETRFEADMARWGALDLDAMAPHELMVLYQEMEERLLWNWKTPIINDFFVMIHYGILRRLCGTWCGDTNGSLQNDLLCGQGEIESTKPARLLQEMARRIKAQTRWREAFAQSSPAELVVRVRTDPSFADLAAEIDRYLARYGCRCMNELKLEEPSLKDRPDFLFQVLRNYLLLDDEALDPRRQDEREALIRESGEARALGAIRGAAGPLRRRIFRRVLANARLGVRNRENLRFARSRIYGLLRELLNALGGHLARAGVLDAPQDIYHLTLDEVWDFVKGTAVTTRLRELAALRKAEFDAYRAGVPPRPDDRFETWGMAGHRNRYRNWAAAADRTGAVPAAGLRGTGCSPGVITGPVKLVRSPRDDISLNREILVAERTDPGWVPLYPAVSGLLIERGSILSHSAIVAREMGIPTIVGIPGLLELLHDGQVVTMDGSAGTVEMAQKGEDGESRLP